MPRAIITRSIGQTTFRPARVSAQCESLPPLALSREKLENETVAAGVPARADSSFDYEIHKRAAEAFAAKYNWPGRLVGGALSDGYAWVFIPDDQEPRTCQACGRSYVPK